MSATLDRRLGVTDAVVVGMASMVGAGVFVAFGPAARAAGSLLLVGLLLAGLVALVNALATAQLAVAMPTSGGAYAFGRARIGPWTGFAAGWGFVVGKSASCAAMAMTVAAYLLPTSWQRPGAAALVVALTAVNLRGITRTATLARWLLGAALVGILVALAAGAVAVADGRAGDGGVGGGSAAGVPGVLGVVQSAALLFFAFAGYARIATLGEEVRDPRRTIPRAVLVALGAVVLLYGAVGITVLAALGPHGVAASAAPLAETAALAGPWTAPVVRAAAGLAAGGALLALITGVSRTVLAMARERDLPRGLAVVDAAHRVPQRAELAVGAVVVVLVLVTDVSSVIGFSSFGVLLYYAIANAAALRQPAAERIMPRWVPAVGLVLCCGLMLSLPQASVLGGTAVTAVGMAGRWVVLRLRGAAAR